MNIKRRTFLKWGVASGASLLTHPSYGKSDNSKYSVCVIGHTGRGNYGHGLDTVWLRSNTSKIIGVADPDEAGLKKAVSRLKLDSDAGFAQYRRMLEEQKPDVVAICPRHPDQHFDMCVASIKSGAKGIYIEKPFVRTPGEADKLISLCESSGVKIAVAHRNRYHPVIHFIKKYVDDGSLGKILELRGRGKGDHRGGGEDLWVLGTHVFDLLSFFGGKVESCSARCYEKGKVATGLDVVDGNENLGLIIGDEIHARFRHSSGVTSYFDSIVNDDTQNHGFGLNIVGSKGVIRIFCDRDPVAYLLEGNPLSVNPITRQWKVITSGGVDKVEQKQDLIQRVQNHDVPAEDLLNSIGNDTRPICSVYDGATTVEMVHSVFDSHTKGGQEVMLPLKNRSNSLYEYSLKKRN